jgi:hypothetical protein
MSRGPGRIERAIRELLDAHPDLAFVTDDLVEHCYPGVAPIERKHQVSVLRAAWNVISRDSDWGALRSNGRGGGWVVFNRSNLQSYGLGRMTASRGAQLRVTRRDRNSLYSKGFRTYVPIEDGDPIPTDAEVLVTRHESYGSTYYYAYFRHDAGPVRDISASLTRLHSAAGHRKDINGRWLRDVQLHCAKRDGFDELANALQVKSDAEAAAERAAWLGGPKCYANFRAKNNETLKDKCYPSPAGGTSETLNTHPDAAAVADRLRALMEQNDPDVLRAGLASVAAELDGRA